MSNVENLIPMSERSKEEVREIATIGGINSGESRRRKKAYTEAVEWLTNSNFNPDKDGDVAKFFKSKGYDISNLTPPQLATLGLFMGAIYGNATNFKTLAEFNKEIDESIGGETPSLKIEIVDNSKLEGTLYESNQHNEND